MKKLFVITIDVEPDCRYDWKYSSPLTFKGVSEGISKRLHPLFNKHHFPPTYLINNVVLEDEASCRIFRNLPGTFELGTHLHPEFIAPEKKIFDYAGKKGEANCCFLSPDVEFAKIENITKLFEERFQYSPLSFRAGRFSAGPNTIKSIESLGYHVDTSVTPHVNWNDRTREQPVDFSSFPEQPYFIKAGSMREQDLNGRILQVPVTISERKVSLLKELKRTYFGLRHTIMRKRPLWLRPVFSTFDNFASIINEYSYRYQANELIVFNMMFHNVEVMPGLSPYTRTEADCTKYLNSLERLFVYCKENNIIGATLNDVYNHYR